ncbi:MAG TPA: site-specific integrase [Acidimicrobiales bacterium]|nr:site-specific integrase [Acidimicrobiales bacterium]
MPGSMRQRGENSWNLRVYAGRDPVTGRKLSIERTVRGNKREASKVLAAMVAEVDRRPVTAAGKNTVAVLCREWLDHATPSFSPKTVETTRMYIEDPIVPILGSIPVAKLTPADLDHFYRLLLEVGRSRGPYAPATIRRVHGIIRRALTQGVRWGWISHNPAIDASPPRVPVKELQPPDPAQVVQLFRFAQDTDPDLATFIILAASSGARRGELLALRWHDIDLDRGRLSIERGIVRVDDRLIEQGTKTHQSRRISLDATTVAALKAHQLRVTERARAASAGIASDGFVFSSAVDGSSPWHPDSTSRAFRRICRQAGVTGVRLHDLRHYVATRLLAAGVDVRTVAGRLGHRNPSTTLNVYSHFLPEADRDAADELGRIFDAADPTQT